MPLAVLEKEIETLPVEAVSEAVDFIRFLKMKFSAQGFSEITVAERPKKKSMFGVWKNEPFYMSPDFDEPLEDFEEYM